MKILGIGFACVDIIRKNDQVYIMNGGTCLNVITTLVQLGWQGGVFLPSLKDDILSVNFLSELIELGVEPIFADGRAKSISRVVQMDEDGKHKFLLTCPVCNRKMVHAPVDFDVQNSNIASELSGWDMLYTDRMTNGIRGAVEWFHEKKKPVMYEPNSGRNMRPIYEMASKVDILKFSEDKISIRSAETIIERAVNSSLKLVIVTKGHEGLCYSYRTPDGEFSAWRHLRALEFSNIEDRSGVGDWLTAGFLENFYSHVSDELYSDEHIRACLEEAMNYSRICASQIGAQGVFHSEQALENLRELHTIAIKNPLPYFNIAQVYGTRDCVGCYKPK